MKKFYETKESDFAIFTILAYVLPGAFIRANFGDASPINLIFLSLLTAFFTVFIVRNGLTEKYGLHFWPAWKPFLFFIPLWILAASNLFLGIHPNYPMPDILFAVCSMALIGFVEEIIFRGFLYRAMEKSNRTAAIIVTSLTFGMGHIINLLTGHGGWETIYQTFYASAIGFTFVIVLDRCGSLWPCIVCHSLVDITARFANNEADIPNVSQVFDLITLGCVVLLLLYSFYLIIKFPRKQ